MWHLKLARLCNAGEGANWSHGEDIPDCYLATLCGEGDDIVGVVPSSDQGVEVHLTITQLHILVLRRSVDTLHVYI